MALRAHLLDPERRAILAGLGDLVDQNLGIALREDARALALAWLDQDDPVLLSGHQVAEDAFAEDGLLRAVHGRALRGGRPTRLLLGRLPDSLGDEALLRTDLTALMDAGAEIGVGPIPGLPWGLFLGTPARARALGGLSADGTIPGGPAFGAGWPGKLPLRETAGAGPLLLEAYDAAWDAARPVVAADLLAPSEPAMQWITVPADSVESVWTDLTRLLAERAGLGPLADLGKLACVSYRDRYFASAAISFVRLVELIKALAPGPGARVQVVSRAPQGRGFASRTAKEILGAEDPPGNLTGLESDAMKKWLVDQIRPRRWSVTVTQTWNIPHARRLDLDFAPGERYRRIEILLEHGFQGVRPAPGRGPWIGRTRVTEEEHVIVRVV
jgi:hypothetical protein